MNTLFLKIAATSLVLAVIMAFFGTVTNHEKTAMFGWYLLGTTIIFILTASLIMLWMLPNS